jgi:hypothetical protein
LICKRASRLFCRILLERFGFAYRPKPVPTFGGYSIAGTNIAGLGFGSFQTPNNRILLLSAPKGGSGLNKRILVVGVKERFSPLTL